MTEIESADGVSARQGNKKRINPNQICQNKQHGLKFSTGNLEGLLNMIVGVSFSLISA